MEKNCISLIGMPGAGKTTIGKKLASELDYAFMDTDLIIESLYSCRLQNITDAVTTKQFRDIECKTIKSISANRCVIATGGSVIYHPEAIAHLKSLGPLIYLYVPLEVIMQRIQMNPERGISFSPGQTINDLFRERCNLYEAEADFCCNTASGTAGECVQWIMKKL